MLVAAPTPVTTTSANALTSDVNLIVKLLPVANASVPSKPKAETTKVAPFFTEIVKLPSLAALVPFLVLLSRTLAPTTGAFFSSITFPVTVIVCACPTIMVSMKAQTLTRIFLPMFYVLF